MKLEQTCFHPSTISIFFFAIFIFIQFQFFRFAFIFSFFAKSNFNKSAFGSSISLLHIPYTVKIFIAIHLRFDLINEFGAVASLESCDVHSTRHAPHSPCKDRHKHTPQTTLFGTQCLNRNDKSPSDACHTHFTLSYSNLQSNLYGFRLIFKQSNIV